MVIKTSENCGIYAHGQFFLVGLFYPTSSKNSKKLVPESIFRLEMSKFLMICQFHQAPTIDIYVLQDFLHFNQIMFYFPISYCVYFLGRER